MIEAKTNKGKTISIKAKGSIAQIMSELGNINIRIIDDICEKTDKDPKSILNLLCMAMNHYYDLIGGSEDEQADTDSEQA